MADKTGDAQQDAQNAEAPNEAQDALQQAKGQMQKAQEELNKPNAQEARAPQGSLGSVAGSQEGH